MHIKKHAACTVLNLVRKTFICWDHQWEPFQDHFSFKNDRKYSPLSLTWVFPLPHHAKQVLVFWLISGSGKSSIPLQPQWSFNCAVGRIDVMRGGSINRAMVYVCPRMNPG
jgi:hypothetical protein